MASYLVLPTPVGEVAVRAEGGAITGLFLKGQRHAPALSWEELPRETSDSLLLAAKAWLIRYFAGENPPVDLPLEPPGTAFQKAVWALLTKIPYGKTVTYGDLARRLSSSPRAVGGAVGRNPLRTDGKGARSRLLSILGIADGEARTHAPVSGDIVQAAFLCCFCMVLLAVLLSLVLLPLV